MFCPSCHKPTYVVDTTKVDGTAEVWRYRACATCGHSFETIERPLAREEEKGNWFRHNQRNTQNAN